MEMFEFYLYKEYSKYSVHILILVHWIKGESIGKNPYNQLLWGIRILPLLQSHDHIQLYDQILPWIFQSGCNYDLNQCILDEGDYLSECE